LENAPSVTSRLELRVAALVFSWLADWVGDLSRTVSTKLAFLLTAHAYEAPPYAK